MKKLWGLTIVLLFGFAAAAGGAGLYSGWPEVFGIHFLTNDGWRMSVGLVPAESGSYSPSVALSLDMVMVSGIAYAGDGSETPDVKYYAGAGVTGSLLKQSPEINGHALLGLEAFFPQVSNIGFLGELQLGQRLWFYPVGTSPFFGFRVGLTLR